MKKLTYLLSALALIGLASCQQEELNPNYDKAKNEVVTSFAFNVATKAQTKGTATAAQVNGNFRGMDQMDLLVATEHPAGAEFNSQYHYQLGTLSSNEISETQSSKIYSLSIPLGVNNMVFYGHATAANDPLQYGKISYNVGTTKAATHFDAASISAEQIADHGNQTVAQQFEYRSKVLEAIVNDIFTAAATTPSEMTWKNYAAQARTAIPVYGYPLWDAYNELTTIQTNEHRAGSGASIVRLLNDIKAICSAMVEGGSIVPDPSIERSLANAIIAKVNLYIGSTNTFKDIDAILSVPAVETVYQSSWNLKTGDLRDFPRKLGLPSGAAQFTYADGKFSYVAAANSFGPAQSGVALDKYSFPAELAYWACSPIRVTDQSVTNDDFPTTVDTWANDQDNDWVAKSWTKNGVVGSSTKGVALQNNINYGTALLKTSVALNSSAAIKDNREAILDRRAAVEGSTNTEEDQEFTAAQLENKFKLLGVLVGGQPNSVSWNWAPASGATFTNVIYDHYMGTSDGLMVPTTTGNESYTMVFDNLKVGAETDGQNIVYVALELQNNLGQDFYGNANIVRDGGIFYLVGALDLSKVDLSAVQANYPVNTDGNGYRYPPLAAQHSGSGTDYSNHEVIRVFMQDFVTEANFTINSLKNAYVTVPDLRAVEMKFGLSVDLKWKAGASFDIALD